MRPLHATSLLLAATFLSSACGEHERTASAASATGAEIVIGAAWPWAAESELLYGKGLAMAADELNATGGVKGRRLRIERLDDRESVDEGRLVAQRVAAERRVSAVIGHMQSYVTVPASAVYDDAGIVLIAPTSTDAALTAHGYGKVFRAIFTDADAGRQMAELAKARGVSRLGIFYIRDDYGRSLSNAFEVRAAALGMTIIDRQSYDPGSQGGAELGDIVRLWKERHVDGVFLAAEAGPAARVAKELRRQSLQVTMLGGDALGIPPLLAEGGDAVEGMLLPTPFHPDEPRAVVRRFSADFTRRYGRPPDALAALGYDAVMVLAAGMKLAGTADADAVARALHEMPGWEGVTGTFRFDSAGDLPRKQIVTEVVRGGRFVYLGNGIASAAPPAP